jgi:hypothetical protein
MYFANFGINLTQLSSVDKELRRIAPEVEQIDKIDTEISSLTGYRSEKEIPKWKESNQESAKQYDLLVEEKSRLESSAKAQISWAKSQKNSISLYSSPFYALGLVSMVIGAFGLNKRANELQYQRDFNNDINTKIRREYEEIK